jgi:hypothetical protein
MQGIESLEHFQDALKGFKTRFDEEHGKGMGIG